MGSDKALLPLGDRNFLQIALGNLAEACNTKPMIVGNRDFLGSYGSVVEDLIPNCGPLGGIHAALSATDSEWNVMLSVDMPLMRPEFLRWLIGKTAQVPASTIVPRVGGHTQPLCALYRRSALPACEKLLSAGDYKIDGLFAEVPTLLVAEAEIRNAGFAPEIFQNVNTPGEYEKILQAHGRSPTVKPSHGRR